MRGLVWATLITLVVAVVPARADEVALEISGGTYAVPVTINGAVKIKFTLDSGASDVLIPADVAMTLYRSGTLAKGDFIGNKTYSLADGSKLQSINFYLREVQVGDQIVRNVVASIGPGTSEPLLGQSFLSRIGTWTLDNTRHVLVLGPPPRPVTAPTQDRMRPSEDVKAAFISGFMKNCIPAAEKSAPNASPTVVKAYCTCMADKTAAITTMDDINYTVANKDMPAALKQHLTELAPGCAAEAQN